MSTLPKIFTGSKSGAPADLQEIAARFRDPYWRLNNLYSVLTKEGEAPVRAELDVTQGLKVPYRMSYSQNRMYWGRHHRNVDVKSRQVGATTEEVLWVLDTCLWNPHISYRLIGEAEPLVFEILKKALFAYETLDPSVKAIVPPLVKQRDGYYEWANGSKMTAGVSAVSQTFTHVHVTEFGVICQKFPKKAEDILASLQAVPAGGHVKLESTARGQAGLFYEIASQARNHQLSRRKLSPLQYRLTFFPWWAEPAYEADPGDVVIPGWVMDYAKKLNHHITKCGADPLSARQLAWYALKAEELQGRMQREYPGTFEEAFAASIEGAYYEKQMSWLREHGRITKVPHDPTYEVHTAWDLGMDDSTSIVFFQLVGKEPHVIDFYEYSGEGFGFYMGILEEKKQRSGYRYGVHVGPHDIHKRDLMGGGQSNLTIAARKYHFKFTCLPLTRSVEDDREAVRGFMPMLWIDEQQCSKLIEHLDNYQKAWNAAQGCWHNHHAKNGHDHGADAFRYFCLAARPESNMHFSGEAHIPLPMGGIRI